jgi:hypothetical protein
MATPEISQSVEWYREGQSRAVIVDGVQVTVSVVGRKGRRARIKIMAPPGAVFVGVESHDEDPKQTASSVEPQV